MADGLRSFSPRQLAAKRLQQQQLNAQRQASDAESGDTFQSAAQVAGPVLGAAIGAMMPVPGGALAGAKAGAELGLAAGSVVGGAGKAMMTGEAAPAVGGVASALPTLFRDKPAIAPPDTNLLRDLRKRNE